LVFQQTLHSQEVVNIDIAIQIEIGPIAGRRQRSADLWTGHETIPGSEIVKVEVASRFCRLSPNAYDGTYDWSGFAVAIGSAGSENEKPVLSCTVIPEPATLALLAIGSAVSLHRRG
jgi:hypothetical protein